MRETFPGYYRPSTEDFRRIWTEGVFAFDANVLLDLYRFSDETVRSILVALETLDGRLWLPFQAAQEYHERVEGVIVDQQRAYENTLKSLRGLLASFQSKRGHPFLDSDLLRRVETLFEELTSSLNFSKQQLGGLLSANPVKEQVADLFTGKIGEPFDEARVVAIHQEGEERYKNRVPPGYEDAKNKEGARRFGDLVLWKQVLEKARSSNLPMVFVTGDVKEDWFVEYSGRTWGPRPELVAEFRAISDVPFYIYTTPAFLEYANQHLAAGIKQEAIQEVKDLEIQRESQQKEHLNHWFRETADKFRALSEAQQRAKFVARAIEQALRAEDPEIYLRKFIIEENVNYQLGMRMLDALQAVQKDRVAYEESIRSSLSKEVRVFEDRDKAWTASEGVIALPGGKLESALVLRSEDEVRYITPIPSGWTEIRSSFFGLLLAVSKTPGEVHILSGPR